MIELIWNDREPDHAGEALIRSAVETALQTVGRSGDVTVMITDASEIQNLNANFRHVDAVTDVLTFPAWEGDSIMTPPDGYLGDIAICYPRAVEQAAAYGHSLRRELAFLAVHGALHLSGFDHMTPEDEQVMLAKQREILDKMGLTR